MRAEDSALPSVLRSRFITRTPLTYVAPSATSAKSSGIQATEGLLGNEQGLPDHGRPSAGWSPRTKTPTWPNA